MGRGIGLSLGIPITGQNPGTSLVDAQSEAYWKASQKSGEYLVDLTGNGHDARFGSVGSARVINKGRAKYLRLPGVSGNYASAPDSAALSITGDVDLRGAVALNDWTPAALNAVVSKYTTAGSQKSYSLLVTATGALRIVASANGSSDIVDVTSSAVTGAVDGSLLLVRVTLDVDDGAGNRVVKFYTKTSTAANASVDTLSDSGWTQLGTTSTTVGTTSIFDSTALLEVGSLTGGQGSLLAGKVYAAVVKSGIDGTTVFASNFTNLADGATSFTESSSNAATVTINSTSGADTNDPTYLAYTGTKYAYLLGIAGNYISTPDSAALSFAGDFTIDAKLSMDDWTPGTESNLVTKFVSTGNQRSYALNLTTAGALRLYTSVDGTNLLSVTSDANLGLTDGTAKWIRASIDVDDGGGNRVTKFYTSDDGITWTQLGTTITSATATSIFDSTAPLEIGSSTLGTAAATVGKFYNAKVYNSYLQASSGTPVFDWNANNATEPYATMLESSSNAATVTFNRAASGKKLAVVDRTMLLLGTDDYLEIQDQANLNFGASDSFTAVVLARRYTGSGGTDGGLISKRVLRDTSLATGWVMRAGNTSQSIQIIFDDGSANTTSGAVDSTTGVLSLLTGQRDVGTDSIISIANTTSSATDTTTGSSANALPVRIGNVSSVGQYMDVEVVGAAIFRKALTAAQLTQVKAELLA